MEHKQISLEQLSDIFAFRVTVDTIEDCYRVLGIVHTTWGTVPGRFKDYISAPKRNNYQSIHTTVYGPRHQRVELQIRTQSMHRVAEYGIAAHALYKEPRPKIYALAPSSARLRIGLQIGPRTAPRCQINRTKPTNLTKTTVPTAACAS